MLASDALFGQKGFLSAIWHMSFFNESRTRSWKSVKKVIPQVTISESKKSGRGRLILSHDSHKNRKFTTE